MRSLLLPLLAGAVGCIPSFEKVDCYSELDCPSGTTCIEGACVQEAPDSGPRDAGTDSGPPDAGAPDTGETDAETPDTGFDAGRPDGGMPDGGTPDGGDLDGGAPDAGFFVQGSPATLDFGQRPVSCPGPDGTVTVTNLGVSPVDITGLALAGGSSPAFTITPITTPFSLGPGGNRDVMIGFLPATVGTHNGRLLVSYDPDPTPITVDLTGSGVAGSTVTDTFTQAAGPIDILFVIDDNDGMVQLQQELSNHVVFMTTALDFEGWDYQIGVTSADTGASGAQGALIGTPTFITSTNVADPQSELETRVMLGETAFPADEGLEASRLALSPPLSTTGANAGFLRPNAALLVIYLANRPDSSPMTVSAYSSFLEGLKTNTARVTANAIVPTVTACTLGDGTVAYYAGRQIGMATDTGGVIDDACGNNWLDSMTTFPVADRTTTFPLQLTPSDPTTIEVRVEGTLVPSNGGVNWTYDSLQNAVVFSPPSAPDFGDQVEITYGTGC